MKPSPAIAFLGPATCVVLALLIAPLALLARDSLNKYDPTELMIQAVTPANYLRFFTDSFYWDVMRTTILVAVLVTILCLALGMPLAYRLARTASRWKSVLMLLVILPLFIGSTVRTVGWMILFAQQGVLDSLAHTFLGRRVDLMYTPAAVVIGTLSVNLPFMVLTLQSVFEGIDTRLEEAAQGLRPPRPARRPPLPDDGTAAVLGVQHQQQLAVQRRAGLHSDGNDPHTHNPCEYADPTSLPSLTAHRSQCIRILPHKAGVTFTHRSLSSRVPSMRSLTRSVGNGTHRPSSSCVIFQFLVDTDQTPMYFWRRILLQFAATPFHWQA